MTLIILNIIKMLFNILWLSWERELRFVCINSASDDNSYQNIY